MGTFCMLVKFSKKSSSTFRVNTGIFKYIYSMSGDSNIHMNQTLGKHITMNNSSSETETTILMKSDDFLNDTSHKIPRLIVHIKVTPEFVIIPIVSSIIIFPILTVVILLLLRHYNQKAREKEAFRNQTKASLMKSKEMMEDITQI